MKYKSKALYALIERLKSSNSINEYEGILTGANLSKIDFAPYCLFDDKGYTRNLLCRCSKFELMLICWVRGQKSDIHDHADSECIMSCIEGELQENQFTIDKTKNSFQFTCATVNILRPYASSRINNQIALHEIVNTHDGNAVSVHLYIPKIDSCKIYGKNSRKYKQSSSLFHREWEIIN